LTFLKPEWKRRELHRNFHLRPVRISELELDRDHIWRDQRFAGLSDPLDLSGRGLNASMCLHKIDFNSTLPPSAPILEAKRPAAMQAFSRKSGALGRISNYAPPGS